jgi:hypothetical protein
MAAFAVVMVAVSMATMVLVVAVVASLHVAVAGVG